jgi:RHS repeat-associated protein
MAGFGVAVAGEDLYVSATVPVAADGTVSFTTTGTVDVTVDVVGVFVRPVDTWTYGYRSDGLRSSKQEAGSAPVEFSWDSSGGLPLLLAQHQGTAASYLVYGPGGTVVYQVRQDGSVLNLHHDQLGSIRLVTTGSNGSLYGTVSYDAYGRITSDTTPWFLERPLVGYTGQYRDTETGLQYLRARYYDPSTGQFLTRDPLVAATMEPYGYASSNPSNFTDPNGLSTCGKISSPRGFGILGSLVDCASMADDMITQAPGRTQNWYRQNLRAPDYYVIEVTTGTAELSLVIARDGAAAYLLLGPGLNTPGFGFRAGWLARGDCSPEDRAAFMKGTSSALGGGHYGGSASIVNTHAAGFMLSEKWALELGVGSPGAGMSHVYGIPLKDAA